MITFRSGQWNNDSGKQPNYLLEETWLQYPLSWLYYDVTYKESSVHSCWKYYGGRPTIEAIYRLLAIYLTVLEIQERVLWNADTKKVNTAVEWENLFAITQNLLVTSSVRSALFCVTASRCRWVNNRTRTRTRIDVCARFTFNISISNYLAYSF